MARTQSDIMCEKLFEKLNSDMTTLDICDKTSSEMEALIGLQQCVILHQTGLSHFTGRKRGKMIYVPLRN